MEFDQAGGGGSLRGAGQPRARQVSGALEAVGEARDAIEPDEVAAAAIGDHSKVWPGWTHIKSAVGVEPANIGLRLPAQIGESAPHENLSVSLKGKTGHRRRVDWATPTRRARIEAVIQAAIGV